MSALTYQDDLDELSDHDGKVIFIISMAKISLESRLPRGIVFVEGICGIASSIS